MKNPKKMKLGKEKMALSRFRKVALIQRWGMKESAVGILIAIFIVACVGDDVQIKLENLSHMSVGTCSQDSVQDYSMDTPEFKAVKTWFINNKSGWKRDIASRTCDFIVKFDKGTILVSKHGEAINFENEKGRSQSAFRKDEKGELYQIISGLGISKK